MFPASTSHLLLSPTISDDEFASEVARIKNFARRDPIAALRQLGALQKKLPPPPPAIPKLVDLCAPAAIKTCPYDREALEKENTYLPIAAGEKLLEWWPNINLDDTGLPVVSFSEKLQGALNSDSAQFRDIGLSSIMEFLKKTVSGGQQISPEDCLSESCKSRLSLASFTEELSGSGLQFNNESIKPHQFTDSTKSPSRIKRIFTGAVLFDKLSLSKPVKNKIFSAKQLSDYKIDIKLHILNIIDKYIENIKLQGFYYENNNTEEMRSNLTSQFYFIEHIRENLKSIEHEYELLSSNSGGIIENRINIFVKLKDDVNLKIKNLSNYFSIVDGVIGREDLREATELALKLDYCFHKLFGEIEESKTLISSRKISHRLRLVLGIPNTSRLNRIGRKLKVQS